LETKVDEVADYKGTFKAALVRLGLHPLLRVEEMLANRSEHGRALLQHRSHIEKRGDRLISNAKMTRRATIEYLKG
jgi:hypothetical protein